MRARRLYTRAPLVCATRLAPMLVNRPPRAVIKEGNGPFSSHMSCQCNSTRVGACEGRAASSETAESGEAAHAQALVRRRYGSKLLLYGYFVHSQFGEKHR